MQPNHFHLSIYYNIIQKESQIFAVQDRYFKAKRISKYGQVTAYHFWGLMASSGIIPIHACHWLRKYVSHRFSCLVKALC